MSREEAHAALAAVSDAMNAQHGDERGRLSQLNSHIATVRMVLDQLFDDAANLAAQGG